MSSDSDSSGTPGDVSEVANAAISNLLPARSKDKYEKTYNLFQEWCVKKKITKISENVLLAYFEEKSNKVKATTLWSTYSMLKSTLNIKKNIDLRKFPKLVPYLKNKSVGYRAKKSKIFSGEDITRFIEEAGDRIYLLMKVAVIMGISGACRREELTKMVTENIEDVGNVFIIKVPDTKTHIERTFTVPNSQFIEIYRKFAALRPKHASTNRLFLKYSNGKCVNQPIGINKIGQIPSLIATYLGKDLSKLFTGHSFRRTSATLLANAGADITTVKRHGGWKSTTVAEAYIEDCLANKINISNKILDNQQPSSSSGTNILPSISTSSRSATIAAATSGINVSNCSNCTFNFNITSN